jgi:pimeloyl-ACP methyl ester carboxylesterase
MTAKDSIVATSFGRIAVRDSGGDAPAALLIHGNSSNKDIFARQFESDLAKSYRLLAFDLPGHGQSEDAADPVKCYSLSAYADLAVELLGQLSVKEAAVLGWSLGGHIGLELTTRFAGLKGLMIVGAPPISLADFAVGFLPGPAAPLSGQEVFSDADVATYARATSWAHGDLDPAIVAGVRRTDGRARSHLFAALASGAPFDHRHIAGTATAPLAILNGGDDPLVNVGFFPTVTYANLWEGVLFVVPGVGHAAFREASEVFNPLFARFLASVLT